MLNATIITEQYSIRRAAKQEKTQAWQVISSCFLLDTCWNDVVNDLLRRILEFGALLLKESLLIVAKHGLPKVFGITPFHKPLAKFVYPKFGGKSENYELPMGDVALAR